MSSTSPTRTAIGCALNARETSLFLELPRELRDRIYIAVLHTSACPPPFPVSMADRVPGSTQDGIRYSEYGENCNTYPRFPLPSTTSALLTLNRQVHSEFKEVISRNETKRPLIYKLDCIIDHDRHLHPTWLSVPALSSSVDVVEVNFRFFGVVKGWYTYDTDGPGELVYNLLPLLERFLMSGPDFLSPAKSDCLKVGELVLNVVSAEESHEGVLPFGAHSVRMTGRKLVDTIVREINQGIQHFRYTIMSFQDSVQVIRVCVDGKGVQTWHVKEGRIE